MRWIAAVAVFVSVAMSGCAAKELSNFKAEGVKKAAFDLGCTEEKVGYKEVSESQVTVTGCGKKATYNQRDGSWQTDSVKSQ